MNVFDISLKVQNGMVVWPGDPQVEIEQFATIKGGDGYNATRFCMSAHTGTHVDAPFHFIDDGRRIHELSLDDLCGPVQVIHVPTNVYAIDAKMIKNAGIEPLTERVLFRTGNSDLWQSQGGEFRKDYVGLTADAADLLAGMQLKLLGTDYLSVAAWDHLHSVHETLLGAGMILLEGLDLSGVSAGRYTLICLPLNLVGADGAPARTVLLQA